MPNDADRSGGAHAGLLGGFIVADLGPSELRTEARLSDYLVITETPE